MFKTKELIYIQMQKTASTHIALLLSKIFDGEQIGKHNPATKEEILSGRYFLSSIRNPWDWYLSLWTFGVQGKGGLRYRLTNKNISNIIKQTIDNPKENFKQLITELLKNTNLWQNIYTSSEDIKSFRKWLKLIHNPKYSRFLGEGYGDTNIYNFCGFMTYRYLYLCCDNIGEIRNSREIVNYEKLIEFEKNNCYIDFFIRQETLEDSLCEVIEKIRPLTESERELIYKAKKTNTSKRKLSISDYYDKESIELIANRDRLLIEKFNYSPPF